MQHTFTFCLEKNCFNLSAMILLFNNVSEGPGVAWWLRHCATSRTVPGSIPGGVTGDFFPWFPRQNQGFLMG